MINQQYHRSTVYSTVYSTFLKKDNLLRFSVKYTNTLGTTRHPTIWKEDINGGDRA